MCLFMAESTLTSGKVSVGQAIEKKQGCWIVFDSQSFPISSKVPKKSKIRKCWDFLHTLMNKEDSTESFLGRNRVIRKLSSAGSCCSRSR